MQNCSRTLFGETDTHNRKYAAVQTVYPPDASSGSLLYPMPTWNERDCVLESTCPSGSEYTESGTCQADGTCLCSGEYVSKGVGASASCTLVPSEDMTYIKNALLTLGLVFFGLQCFLSVSCAAWTVYYTKRQVVRASQPIFLHFVSFGTFLISTTIIPLGIEGTYREDEGVEAVDAACMAVPWLFSLGFAIVFSALAAKIFRITKVMQAAANFQKKKVEVKDVMAIMVAVIMAQVVILLCWQFIDPMTWQRDLVSVDINGYPTQSVGSCQSDHVLRYLVPLVVVDFVLLAVALVLCFKSRNLSSEFQEGTYIAASVVSMIQILILAVPILVIVENDTSAFYFVLVVVVFLISFTVQCLIFFPKIYRLHFGAGGGNTRRSASVLRPRTSEAGSGAYGSSYAAAEKIQKMSSVLSTNSEVAPSRDSGAERRPSYVTKMSSASSNGGGRDSPPETPPATGSGQNASAASSSRSLVTGVIPSGEDDATARASEKGPEETTQIDEEQAVAESGDKEDLPSEGNDDNEDNPTSV